MIKMIPWDFGITSRFFKPEQKTIPSSMYKNRPIGLMGRVFANGQGDWISIPGQVIPKAQKMILDFALLNTQDYNVRIKGKMEQSRE